MKHREPVAEMISAARSMILQHAVGIDPLENLLVVGFDSEVRRLIDGDGGGAGADLVVRPTAVGLAALALSTRDYNVVAHRAAGPLENGKVRLLVLVTNVPHVHDIDPARL